MITDRLNTALAGRYKIEKQLGQGGMATVYLAQDQKHDRKVAVKVLKPELAAVLGAERFVVEIKTTAALQHPHILPLFDSGTADGFLYYVMPYIEGETLRGKLNRETQFSVDEAVRITAQVADALDYAHRHGVIHRDIKPENILLHDGRPMVADFGIALAVSAAAGGRMTETGLSLGTPHYMSPEQATAEKEITGRSDIYSLASMLYEMLAGEPPHMGGSAQQIIMKIITDVPAPVTKFRKSVPPHVAAALAVALEKLPADRFETAKAFADALANPSFAPAYASTGPAASAAARTSRWRAVLVPLAAAATGALGMWAVSRSARTGEPGVLRLLLALPAEQRLQPGGGVALSADGRSFAYTSDNERILVKRLDQLRARPVPGDAHGYGPILSPDGSAVAYFTGDPGNLVVVPLAGGAARILVRDSATSRRGAWTADGWIYMAWAGGAIARARDDGSRVEQVVRPDPAAGELAFNMVDPLPGNRAVVCVLHRKGQRSEIVAIDVASGVRQVLGQGVYARYLSAGYLLFARDDGTATVVRFDAKRLRASGPVREALRGADVAVFDASADGTMLYAPKVLEASQVVRVSRDGVAQVLDPAWRDTVNEVSLSPDGRRLAFARVNTGVVSLWVKELDVGPAMFAGDAPGMFSARPAWRPDSRGVGFISSPVNGANLARERPIGSATPARTIATSPRGIDEVAWSSDGRWLVMRTGAGGNRDIAAMRVGVDSVPRPIVATSAEELSPALSPDGKWLAYVSDESGLREVWVAPFPNAESGRRMVSIAGATEPAWSPDGRELYFKSGGSLHVVAVRAVGGGLETSAPRALFSVAGYFGDINHTTYAVGRGASPFYMSRRLGASGEQLVMERGWLTEVLRGGNR